MPLHGVASGLDAFSWGAPSVGEEVIPPAACDSKAVPMTSGQLLVAFFTAQRSEAITKIRLKGGTTAAGATPSLVQAAIYNVNASSQLTGEIAHTTNDTSIFAAAQTEYEKALSATFQKAAGVTYAVGLLVISAAAMPNLIGKLGLAVAQNAGTFNRPRLSGNINGQAALPSAFPVTVGTPTSVPSFLLEP